MKDSPFLANVVSPDTVASLQAVGRSPTLSLSEMVKVAGLDQTRDLRHSDLSGTNLTNSDLRGYDLTGADLRGAAGIRVTWDHTTILESADLTGSIFAAKVRLDELFATNERARNLLAMVSRASWSEQAVWAATHLQSTGKHHDIAVPVVEALFYRAKDDFLKAELLRYVAPRLGSPRSLREMLIAALSDDPDTPTIVRTAFVLLRREDFARDPAVRQLAFALMGSANLRIREWAFQFVMRTTRSRQEIEAVRKMAISSDPLFITWFVAEMARRLGDAYDLVTRDPVTNATLPIGASVTPRMRDLIARRWLRAESSEHEHEVPLAMRRRGTQFHDSKRIAERAKKVSAMWDELAAYGVEFKKVNDPIESDLTLVFAIEEDS